MAEAGTAGEPTEAGGQALARAIDDVRRRVSEAIAEGANLIILSDRNSTAELAPIPSLLLVAAIHQHLVARRPAPGSAWWSRAVTPVRCTTWPCSSGTGRPRSTRT